MRGAIVFQKGLVLVVLLWFARNAAKSALSSEPGNTVEAARAHIDLA